MADFNLVTNGTTGSNRERVRLYKASAPNAHVSEIIFPAPHVGGHTWPFHNLIPSENYLYRWTEIDGSGNDIQQYGSQNFTVPAYGSLRKKDTAYLTADVTPGVNSGMNTIVMDGSGGKDDWRGWNIIWEKKGFGTEFPGVEYSYNINTGTVTLTNADGSPYDIEPAERFTVQFEDQIAPAPVTVTGLFSGIKYVNVDTTLLPSDFGKNLIKVEGTGTYLEITLPPILNTAENKELIIHSGRGNHLCVAIISSDANAIDYLEGSRNRIHICPSESLKIYRQNNNGVNTWQVMDADGNFKTVGLIVSEFTLLGNQINRVPATSALYDVYEQARLYEYVQKLTPGDEVVAFASRAGNERKYTLANNAGKFYVPDLSDLYERSSDGIRVPGDYLSDMVGPINPGKYAIASNGQVGGSMVYARGGSKIGEGDVTISTGTETRPKTFITRRYILC